eukprot:11883851-Alexandrium_andersonii.AAC.1
MSASLVGSEMCIRDRAPPGRARPCRVGMLCCAVVETPVRRVPPGSAAPVSYTHLTLPTICSV